MGCDIHLFVERLNPNTMQWEFVEARGVAPQSEFDKKNGYWDWYGGRNYDLFAILADVRNGYGFAGVDTGDGFKPIAQPRGVPSNASPEYKREVSEWGGDGHSHSYFTLKELLGYDWSQTTTKRGVFTALQYMSFQMGTPDGYSGDVRGQSVIHIGPEEMDNYIKTSHFANSLRAELQRWTALLNAPERTDFRQHDLDKVARLSALLEVTGLGLDASLDARFSPDKSYYTRIGWQKSYADCAGYFLSTTLPALEALSDSPEQIRIVFFFDN